MILIIFLSSYQFSLNKDYVVTVPMKLFTRMTRIFSECLFICSSEIWLIRPGQDANGRENLDNNLSFDDSKLFWWIINNKIMFK